MCFTPFWFKVRVRFQEWGCVGMYRTVVLLLVGLVLLTAGSPRLFSLAAAPQAIAQRRAPAAVVLRSSGRGVGVPGQQGASSAWPAALPDWGTGVPGASSAQGTRASPRFSVPLSIQADLLRSRAWRLHTRSWR